MAGWIREDGRDSRAVESLGSTVAFDALRQNQIDLYVDYSGTVWATIKREQGLPESREVVLRKVGDWLEAEHEIGLVAALGFQNTYALGMRRAQAEELGVRTIADLRAVAPRLRIGGDFEFFSRAEWKAIAAAYDLRFQEERSMDSALMYQAVAAGEVDVISAYSTDGRIPAFDLVLLEDDRGVIPPYDAILLAGSRLREESPDLVRSLAGLEGRIDEARMQKANYAVDEEGRSPREVGRAMREALAGAAAP